MKSARISRLLIVGVLTMTSAYSTAFAQSPEPVAPSVTVQQVKNELDKMTPKQRELALSNANADARKVQEMLLQADWQLQKAESGPHINGRYLFGSELGIGGMIFSTLAVGHYQGGYVPPMNSVSRAVFLGSALLLASSMYYGNKDLKKQKEIYLSGEEIARARDKVHNLQGMLDVEMARIDLLKNFYGIAIQ